MCILDLCAACVYAFVCGRCASASECLWLSASRNFCEPGRPQDAHKHKHKHKRSPMPIRRVVANESFHCECRSCGGNRADGNSETLTFLWVNLLRSQATRSARLLNQRLENAAATLLSVRPASQPASRQAPATASCCSCRCRSVRPKHATSNWEKLSLLSS